MVCYEGGCNFKFQECSIHQYRYKTLADKMKKKLLTSAATSAGDSLSISVVVTVTTYTDGVTVTLGIHCTTEIRATVPAQVN